MPKSLLPDPRSSFGLLEQSLGTELVHVVHSWIADITSAPVESASTENNPPE